MARNPAATETTETTENSALSEPATPAAPTGLQAAENFLAESDEDVTLMWTAKGPKNGRVEQIGAFLYQGAVMIALIYKSGKFKLYQPMPEPAVAQA